MSMPYFRVPLNLPHAATLNRRLLYQLDRVCRTHGLVLNEREALEARVDRLQNLLDPFFEQGDNPPPAEAAAAVAQAAVWLREIVDAVERHRIGDDRLGQVIRNLFECMELGEEGARQSLRAGENPDSALRAVD
ncbi:MAG: hypothetical protein AMXMBFR7_37920 [Planctomycetota bacterium]